MPITVYGAGAIGGITGAALARAGHDVLLVDSAAAHVDAINTSGLTVERDGAATVIDIIHDIEEGRRRMDWANLDPLVTLAAGRRPPMTAAARDATGGTP
jgi:ketopantoate reductase